MIVTRYEQEPADTREATPFTCATVTAGSHGRQSFRFRTALHRIRVHNVAPVRYGAFMSKSKRRKTPNRKPVPASAYGKRKQYPTAKKLIAFPDGRQEHRSYHIRLLRIDLPRCLGSAHRLGPEFALALIPAAFTVEWMRTHPANVCAQACIHLFDVYQMLGIEAHILPVTVAVAEGEDIACYGDERPRWEGEVYWGHCMVNLPGLKRFVDPTIQQFDGFQHLPYPYIGKTVVNALEHQDSLVGERLGLQVDGRSVIYTVLDADEGLVAAHPMAENVREGNSHAPAMLAGQVVDALRRLEIAKDIPESFPRVRAMLDAVGDAPLIAEHASARFDFGGQLRWVDELIPT